MPTRRKIAEKQSKDIFPYKPISLLTLVSEIFEKLLLEIHFQVGFRRKHATVDQVHRISPYH